MTWFYNSDSGEIVNESPPAPEYFALEAYLHTGTGWHAYATQADVDTAVAANHWPPPTTSLNTAIGNDASTIPAAAAKDAGNALSSALSGLNIHWPGADTFLARALKIVIGGVMLVAGILKLSGGSTARIPLPGV